MDAPVRPDERPILDVPSIPLGPAIPDAAPPEPVTGQAALSLAFLFGAFLLAVAVIVGLVAANIVLWNLGRISFGLVILVVVAVVGLGKAVVVSMRRPPDDPGEIEIPAAEEPELHAMIGELAAEVGTRAPDRVVVIPAVNAYVHEYGRLLGLLPGRRTLAIGTPLFDALDVTQLRAVLGHELGHFAGGDTKTGPIVYRTAQVVSHLATSLRGGILSRLFTGLWSLQHRMTVGARRRQELIADRAAVRIAGRQSTVDALTRVEVAGRADAVYHTRLLVPLVGAGYRPDDLAAGLRHVLADDSTIARLAAEAAADTSPGDPHAVHPPARERVARVAAIDDAGPVSHDGRRAGALLRRPDHWAEVAFTRAFDAATAGMNLTTVPWSTFPEVVTAPSMQSQAADIDQALAGLGLAPGVAGVRAALAGGRERDLSAALVRRGWRAQPAATAAIPGAATTVTLAGRAMAAGATLNMSWNGVVALRSPDGQPVPLEDWTDAALAGRWDDVERTLGPIVAAPAAVAATPVAPPAESTLPPPAAAPAVTSLPEPPMPPFERADGEWRYRGELPGLFGSKTWLISDTALSVGGEQIEFADVATFSFKFEGAAVGSGLNAKIRINGAGGKKLKASMQTMSGKGKETTVGAVMFLWELLGVTAGARLNAEIVARVRAGETVEVAKLFVSPAGISGDRNGKRLLPWAQVHDARIDGGNVVVLTATSALTVPISNENAFLLPGLVPELRVLFN